MGLLHLTTSLSRIVCRRQGGPMGSKSTLRPDVKVNVTTRYRKEVVRSGIVSLGQFDVMMTEHC